YSPNNYKTSKCYLSIGCCRYKMERREMWWDSNNKAKYDRNYCGTFVNIFYARDALVHGMLT
ncbi:MAG: hypothetical protein ACPIOQ_80335, partial [Promethearchaeia archaeon]